MSILNYYVIHMKDRKDRYDNIKIMEEKLKHPIQIFFGINGNEIKESNIIKFDKNLKIKKNFNLKGQLGCYLSHFLLLKEIYSNNFNYDYTIIFEDDFVITVNDLDEKINEAIKKIDIDIDFIFLGIEGYCVGENYKDNLYYINKNLKTWGFQGYVVKNKNIYRILQHLYEIIYEVDIQIFKIIKNNLLVSLFFYPNYVNQNKNFISTIRPHIKQNLRSYITPNLRPHIKQNLRSYITPNLRSYITPNLRSYITPNLRSYITLKQITQKKITPKKNKIIYNKPVTKKINYKKK